MEQYYTILGISQGASKSEIKKAYRKLAMLYHPDKNDNGKEAEQKFIRLTEAYEILIGERKAPIRRVVQNHYRRRQQFDFRQASYRQRWETERARRRNFAREEARRQAQMDFENFKRNNAAFRKSWYYKPAYYLIRTLYVLGMIFGIGLLLSPLLLALYYYFTDGQWWRSFTCIPLMLGGIICINVCNRIRNEAEPYFQ